MNSAHFNPYPMLATGFVFAIILSFFAHIELKDNFLLIWTSLYGFMLLASMDTARSMIRLFVGALLLSLLATSTLYWHNSEGFTIFLLLFISTFAINAYHIAYQKNGLPFNYDSLFHGVWDTWVKLMLACMVLGVSWGVLMICSSLFDLIGISFFSTLFSYKEFIAFFNVFMVSVALIIAAHLTKIVRQLRNLILYVYKVLLPVLSIIGILFAFTALFITLGMKQALQYDYVIYTTMAYWAIIFVNAVYQKGEVSQPYSHWMLKVISLFILILPVFPILAFVSLTHMPSYSAVGELGGHLHNGNVNQTIVCALLFFYTLAYVRCVLSRGEIWLHKIQGVNVILGIFLICSIVLTNNYWFKLDNVDPKVAILEFKDAAAINFKRQLDTMASLGVVWQDKSESNTNLVRYAVRNGASVYLCRMNVKGKYYVGSVESGNCVGVVADKVYQSDQYDLLTSKRNNVTWKMWGINAVVIRLEGNAVSQVCRIIHEDEIRVGEYQGGYCRYVANGAVYKESGVELLVIE